MSAGYKTYQIKNFIKKTVTGKLDIEKSKKIIQELAVASSSHQNYNLLVDIREIEPLQNYSEVLKIVSEISKFYHAFHCRIAIVIANEPDRIARAKFFKAGLKEGKYRLEYFTDIEKAVDWVSVIKDSPGRTVLVSQS